MVIEPKMVHVTSGGELDRLVDVAKETPVILEKDGIRYRLGREDDAPSANYDPEAVLAALRAGAGALSAEEAEAMKNYVYRAREEGSQPAKRNMTLPL